MEAIKNTSDLVDGTYEVMGPHFQRNTMSLDKDQLIRHGSVVIDNLSATDIQTIKKWLEDHEVEGIVFWNESEPVTKIRRVDFGIPWNNHKAKHIGVIE